MVIGGLAESYRLVRQGLTNQRHREDRQLKARLSHTRSSSLSVPNVLINILCCFKVGRESESRTL